MSSTLNDIQKEVRRRYTEWGEIVYIVTCLAGEAGELCNWVKKLYRDDKVLTREGLTKDLVLQKIKEEIPDVLFYVTAIANHQGWDLQELWNEKMKVNDKKYSFKVDEK